MRMKKILSETVNEVEQVSEAMGLQFRCYTTHESLECDHKVSEYTQVTRSSPGFSRACWAGM